MIYCGMFCLTLFTFGMYTACLMTDNITSNENIRTRWNAARLSW
jgi:hypothetical protein